MVLYTIGIVGGGFVGSATAQLGCDDLAIKVYDIDESKCMPADTTMLDVSKCDLVFVCVPTPSREDGSCNTDIVESVVKELREKGSPQIVVRSTVPPNTCERLGVGFMPEFLRERTAMQDFRACEKWYLGGGGELKNLVSNIMCLAHAGGRIRSPVIKHYENPTECELIKYTRNAFLATKVAFCNEIYDFCNILKVDYNTVIKGVADDDRIGGSHTTVPGHDGKRGFGGFCLPKDTKALSYLFSELGVKEYVLRGVLKSNEKFDRKEVHETE